MSNKQTTEYLEQMREQDIENHMAGHGDEDEYDFDPDEAYEAYIDGLTISQLRASKVKPKSDLFGLAADIIRLQSIIKPQAE